VFDSRHYEVRQKLGIRTRYNVYEGDAADPFLTSKKKSFKLKEDFRFSDPETGEDVFRVRADSVLDISAAYDIVDERTGERVGSVKRSAMSMFKHEYQLLDADGNLVGTVSEDNWLMAFLRRQLSTLIPFTYSVDSPEGAELAEISERFSFRDKYDIDIESDDVDPRLLVVGAVVIDAIEGN
jgi:hypothetical protein